MGNRAVQWLKSDTGVLVLLAVVRVALHTLTNGQYGFHRDELQTLDDARHLDWGFVAYPPITPLIGRTELALFGTSLVGFRFFAAVAVSAVMVVAGWIARELGGGRREQVLAAIAVGIAPVSLTQGAVMQYVSFDYLWGGLVAYFAVRLVKSEDARWWLAIGAVLGLGMETRYTMGFLALGLVGGLLMSQARRYLLQGLFRMGLGLDMRDATEFLPRANSGLGPATRARIHLSSGCLWLGVGVSVLIFLPNILWQWRHQFISLDFLSHIHTRDVRQGRSSGFLMQQAWVCVNIFTVPVTLLGLWFYLVREEGKRYRLLGWTFVVTFALFYLAHARSYYTMALYPMLLAAGSVAFGKWLDGLRPAWSKFAQGLQWTGIVVGGAVFTLLVVPVAPIGSHIWRVTSKLHDQFREEIGWPDLAEGVARVFDSLPTEERARTGILTGNYGEGGALNLYGAQYGLPHAMSGTNSFWYRGYDQREPQTVVLVGFDLEEGQELFESCAVAAQNVNRYLVVNEESKEHPDILLCRNLKKTWPEFWKSFRRFG